MQPTPILLNSCGLATTAAESRFRIDVPLVPSRATRIIALDDPAAEVVERVSRHSWCTARFYRTAEELEGGSGEAGLRLRGMVGGAVDLVDELDAVDAVVMVATSDTGARSAATIGAACTVRGIMTAGLVLSDGTRVLDALSSLRPHARVLLVPAEEEDLIELLRAIRA